MMRSRSPFLRPLAAVGLLALVVAPSGCYNPFAPRLASVLGFSQPAPVPSSSSNLMRLFEWCYNQKAISEYRELFTEDYRFYFNPVDSAGSDWRATPWRREDEMIYATQLFVGGSAVEPPANTIRLIMDKNFYVYPDPAFVQTDPRGRWHTNIRTQVTLNIRTEDGQLIEISGAAVFYLIRGDFAVIPEELKAMGFGPDSTRWYIREWRDETIPSDPGGGGGGGDERAQPAPPALLASSGAGTRSATTSNLERVMRLESWGYVKDAFRSR